MENPQDETEDEAEFNCAVARQAVQMFRTWQRQQDEKVASQWITRIVAEIKTVSEKGGDELVFNSRTFFQRTCWEGFECLEPCWCCSCFMWFELFYPEKVNLRVMRILKEKLVNRGFYATLVHNRTPSFYILTVQWAR